MEPGSTRILCRRHVPCDRARLVKGAPQEKQESIRQLGAAKDPGARRHSQLCLLLYHWPGCLDAPIACSGEWQMSAHGRLGEC